jgi:hypothetical protein
MTYFPIKACPDLGTQIDVRIRRQDFFHFAVDFVIRKGFLSIHCFFLGPLKLVADGLNFRVCLGNHGIKICFQHVV